MSKGKWTLQSASRKSWRRLEREKGAQRENGIWHTVYSYSNESFLWQRRERPKQNHVTLLTGQTLLHHYRCIIVIVVPEVGKQEREQL